MPYFSYIFIFSDLKKLLNFVLEYAAKSLQSCPTLCDPIDGSPPGFPVPGILQARTLEWVAISFSNAWKWKVKVKSESEVVQSCLTLSDPMDCSLTGSSIHGIFQAKVLEWSAIAFSVLEYRRSIMLWWFQVDSKGTQLSYTWVHSLPNSSPIFKMKRYKWTYLQIREKERFSIYFTQIVFSPWG